MPATPMVTVPFVTAIPVDAVTSVMATLTRASQEGGPPWWREQCDAISRRSFDTTRIHEPPEALLRQRALEWGATFPCRYLLCGEEVGGWDVQVEALHPFAADGVEVKRWLMECHDFFGGKPIFSVLDFRQATASDPFPCLAKTLVPRELLLCSAPPLRPPMFRHAVLTDGGSTWILESGEQVPVSDSCIWPCFPRIATDCSITTNPESGESWGSPPPPALADMDLLEQDGIGSSDDEAVHEIDPGGRVMFWFQDGLWYAVGVLPVSRRTDGDRLDHRSLITGVALIHKSAEIAKAFSPHYIQEHSIEGLFLLPVWDSIIQVVPGYPLASWIQCAALPPHMSVPSPSLRHFTAQTLDLLEPDPSPAGEPQGSA